MSNIFTPRIKVNPPLLEIVGPRKDPMCDEKHILTIHSDGEYECSCGKWNSKLTGNLFNEWNKKNGITEEVIMKWHKSHENAYIVKI
jgi:hypothetical protein